MRWLDGIIDLTDMSLSKPREIVKGREAWCVHVVTKSQTQVSDFTFTFHFHELEKEIPQGSCLENARDGGAWWAAVYGVAQSQTRLKRLSSSPFLTDAGLHYPEGHALWVPGGTG